jgi:hypothetical protein
MAVGCRSQMSDFTKEQYIGVMQMLDRDDAARGHDLPMCGQASGGSRVFDIWDLQGAFDQFLRQAAPLVAKDRHFPPPPKNSIIQIQNLLPETSLSPLRNRGSTCPVVAQRITT